MQKSMVVQHQLFTRGEGGGAFIAVLKIPIEIHIFNIAIYRIYVCVSGGGGLK